MVFVISSEAANTDSQVNLWFNVYIREGSRRREQQFKEFDTKPLKSSFNILTESTTMWQNLSQTKIGADKSKTTVDKFLFTVNCLR
jgi:hypothetical protein